MMQPGNILPRYIRNALLAQCGQDDLLEQAPVFSRGAGLTLGFRVLGEEPRRQLGDGWCQLGSCLGTRGIGPFGDFGEYSQSFRACGLGGPGRTMPANRVPALLPSRIGSILQDITDRIAVLAACRKARQPAIPYDFTRPQSAHLAQPDPLAFACHPLATI